MRWTWGVVIALGGCELVFDPESSRAQDGGVADAAVRDAEKDVDASTVRDDAAPPADASTECPADYGDFSGRRYRAVTTLVPFAVAAADCADDEIPGSQRRTHLVVFDDNPERGLVNATFPLPVAWIGLTDIRIEGEWRWVTLQATPGYPPPAGGPWGDSQPDDGDGGGVEDEDCVWMNAIGAELGDGDCALGLRYICECDLFADTPAQYTPG